ncbi:MAG: class I SAM-dependent methyltransferase [Promethearchaeota archaeon]
MDVKNFYEKSARFYDLVHHFQTLYADTLHRIAVVDAAKFKNGDLVLDIGTGTSLAAICAINQTYPHITIRVIGIDLTRNMLLRARKNLQRFHIKNQILTINCDARYLPLRKSLFSKVISVYGIGGVKSKLKQMFIDVMSCTKESAIFSFGEMSAPPYEKGLFRRKVHEILVEPFINCVWHFRDLNLGNLLKAFNIKILKRKYYDNNYLGSMTLLVGKRK